MLMHSWKCLRKKITKIVLSVLPALGLCRASLPDLNIPGLMDNEETVWVSTPHSVLGAGRSLLIMPGSEFFSECVQQFRGLRGQDGEEEIMSRASLCLAYTLLVVLELI